MYAVHLGFKLFSLSQKESKQLKALYANATIIADEDEVNKGLVPRRQSLQLGIDAVSKIQYEMQIEAAARVDTTSVADSAPNDEFECSISDYESSSSGDLSGSSGSYYSSSSSSCSASSSIDDTDVTPKARSLTPAVDSKQWN